MHEKSSNNEEVASENTISVKGRITPKLLRLMWNGFPLFHSVLHGWGYLIPKLGVRMEDIQNEEKKYPYEYIFFLNLH